MTVRYKTIAINVYTGERKEFESRLEAVTTLELAMSSAVASIKSVGKTTANGWLLFQNPSDVGRSKNEIVNNYFTAKNIFTNIVKVFNRAEMVKFFGKDVFRVYSFNPKSQPIFFGSYLIIPFSRNAKFREIKELTGEFFMPRGSTHVVRENLATKELFVFDSINNAAKYADMSSGNFNSRLHEGPIYKGGFVYTMVENGKSHER